MKKTYDGSIFYFIGSDFIMKRRQIVMPRVGTIADSKAFKEHKVIYFANETLSL